MRFRCIFQSITNERGDSTKIYRDGSNDEYRVCFYNQGEHKENADYFTANRLDACYTAIATVFGVRAV
jgi:hypothetical protein